MNKVKQVFDYLDKNNIQYKVHEHPAVFTCEEAEKHCKNIPGVASKNLLLRDKKKTRFILLTMPPDKQVDLKEFSKKIEAKNLSFASPELLKEKLELTPGSVSPFGLLNDKNKEVELFIEKDLFEASIKSFHPNDNTATIELTKEDFGKFLKSLGRSFEVIKI